MFNHDPFHLYPNRKQAKRHGLSLILFTHALASLCNMCRCLHQPSCTAAHCEGRSFPNTHRRTCASRGCAPGCPSSPPAAAAATPAGRGFSAGGNRQTATAGVLGMGVSPTPHSMPQQSSLKPSPSAVFSMKVAINNHRVARGTLAPTSHEVTVADRGGCLNYEAHAGGHAAVCLLVCLPTMPVNTSTPVTRGSTFSIVEEKGHHTRLTSWQSCQFLLYQQAMPVPAWGLALPGSSAVVAAAAAA